MNRLSLTVNEGTVLTMNELIDALRNCADYSDCGICKLNGKFNCADMMMRDAADAIERLMDEIDRKDKALQAWVNTWDNAKGKLIDRICENCDTPPDVRLRVCGDCPIVQPIREVFNEQ